MEQWYLACFPTKYYSFGTVWKLELNWIFLSCSGRVVCLPMLLNKYYIYIRVLTLLHINSLQTKELSLQ